MIAVNGWKKKILLSKWKQVKAEDIYKYAQEYNISLSKLQAKQISEHIQSSSYDPTKQQDRTKMLKQLAKITNLETAQKCNRLFHELIKQYGVEDLFK